MSDDLAKSYKGNAIRILLTGVSGQVGGDLLPLLSSFAEVTAPSHAELDLTDETGIRRYVREAKPHWIINPAAYTAVDRAETEPDAAHALNSDTPRVLGEEAARLSAPVIHFSTDYVFDGTGERPWREDDSTSPVNVYGASKLAGERALAATSAAHLIFRTSWVYGTRGKNFVKTILRLAQEREELRIVADQFGAPTWSRDLARMVSSVVESAQRAAQQGLSVSEYIAKRQGIYHAAGQGTTTWFGFADHFLSRARALQPEISLASLQPMNTAEYPTPAARPLNSRLDCSRLHRTFGQVLPDWRGSASQVISELVEQSGSTS